MSSSDAHVLATQIQAEQTRWRVNAIRLVRNRTCCLVVVDSRTGEEHHVESAAEWRDLRVREHEEA